MSLPFGSQPAVSQPNPPAEPGSANNLGFILVLVATGLSLLVYACSFSDVAAFGLAGGSVVLALLLAGGLLAGVNVLPKAPKTLLPAAVLTAVGVLILLLVVIKSEGSTPAILLIILIASILQLGAVVTALLMELGLVNLGARKAPSYGGATSPWTGQPSPFPQQGYGQAAAGAPYGGQYGSYGAAPPGGVQYGQHGSPGPLGPGSGQPGVGGPGAHGSAHAGPGGPGGAGSGAPGGLGGPGGPGGLGPGGPGHGGLGHAVPGQAGPGQGGPARGGPGQGGAHTFGAHATGVGGPADVTTAMRQASGSDAEPGSSDQGGPGGGAGRGGGGSRESRPGSDYGQQPYRTSPYGEQQSNPPGGF
jgi:hypothetical protein